MDDTVNHVEYCEVSAKEQIKQVDKIFKTLLTNIIENEKLKEKISIKPPVRNSIAVDRRSKNYEETKAR